MNTTYGTRNGGLAAVVLASVLAISACQQVPQESEEPSVSFWPSSARLYGASEVVGPGTVDELAELSDAVVAGRFTEFCEGTVVQGDAEEDRFQYDCLVLEIEETLAGADLGRTVPVEFLGGGDPESDVDAQIPDGTVVIFLVDKGGAEAGRFRAVSSYGLWAWSDRGPLDQPMREFPPSRSEPEVAEPLANATTVDELVGWLRGRW